MANGQKRLKRKLLQLKNLIEAHDTNVNKKPDDYNWDFDVKTTDSILEICRELVTMDLD
jgi:hypothetical protein